MFHKRNQMKTSPTTSPSYYRRYRNIVHNVEDDDDDAKDMYNRYNRMDRIEISSTQSIITGRNRSTIKRNQAIMNQNNDSSDNYENNTENENLQRKNLKTKLKLFFIKLFSEASAHGLVYLVKVGLLLIER